MAVKKIAISVATDVLKKVDRLARKTGATRSGFITQVLRDVSNAQTQAEITDRINRLFAEPNIVQEQLSTSRTFLRAAEPNNSEEPTDW